MRKQTYKAYKTMVQRQLLHMTFLSDLIWFYVILCEKKHKNRENGWKNQVVSKTITSNWLPEFKET